MPNKRGPNTYKGFLSPPTTGYPKSVRDTVKHVYGLIRAKQGGSELPADKASAARIAWYVALKKK